MKKDLARLNIILKYLQENYKQNIALEDIEIRTFSGPIIFVDFLKSIWCYFY